VSTPGDEAGDSSQEKAAGGSLDSIAKESWGAAAAKGQAHLEKSCQHVPGRIQLQQAVVEEGHAERFASHSKDADGLEGEFHLLLVSEGLSEAKQGLVYALLHDFSAEVDVRGNLLKGQRKAWCLV